MDLSIGQCATLACLLEVSAPKPGNVHRGADFEDCTLNDFMASGVAIGSVLDHSPEYSVGETILRCVKATQTVTHHNTNLGIVLLFAPLAAVPNGVDLRQGVRDVLQGLTDQDSQSVYQAIRLAAPGGLQHVDDDLEFDLEDAPPANLLDAMQEAAQFDTIAKQYVDGFQDVFGSVSVWLNDKSISLSLIDRIVYTHVRLMSEIPDTLIQRKCGLQIAKESSLKARQVLQAGSVRDESYHQALSDFDFWLRSDGHRRNPGTTADLIAAGLFVGLRNETLRPPFH